MTKEEFQDLQTTLDKLVDLAVSNNKPSLPSNIDEAAQEYFLKTYGINNIAISEDIKRAVKFGAEWMIGQGVSLSHLIAWYIQSVDAHEPVWTEEHLKELVKDYILIPKKQ